MNAVSMAYTNDNRDPTRNAPRAAPVAMGLGPNQLSWLRRRIGAFKDAEEQRRQMRQDVVRAARIAGLI